MENSLAIALCLILAAILSVEWRVSSAVLEVMAGVLLALLIPGIATTNWLLFLSKLGMLALMFVAGFELEVRKLRKTWRASAAIGASSLLLPLAGLYLVARYALVLPPVTAALVSIGLSTTSLALVYHVLRTRFSRPGQVMFGAASVVDVLSMILLALILGDVGWGTAAFVVFLALSAVSLPHFGAWVFQRYSGSVAEPELRFLLSVLVGMGFMAENFGGIHPAIIAFTAGMIMSGVLEKNEDVRGKMLSLVFSFFAPPLFFLQAGARIDIRDLHIDTAGFALLLFVLAVSLKFLGTWIPARAFLKEKARFAAILFNYRLSFGIIAANVGLEAGLIDRQLYTVIMLAVVASAALPGFFLRRKAA